jgi:hypothetical protein
MSEIAALIREFGIGVISVAAIIYLLWTFAKSSLAQQKIMTENAVAERKAWQEVIGGITKGLDEHTAQSRSFHESVNEAHRHSREEHKEMIQILGRINGYKDH